jgi:RHS repeat-associated protein
METSGATNYTRTFSPFGETIGEKGIRSSVYGYTGQQEDVSTGLIYLRARYYSAELKAFTAYDVWPGDSKRPLSLNHYAYTEGNPINYFDPTGFCRMGEADYYLCVLAALRLAQGEYSILTGANGSGEYIPERYASLLTQDYDSTLEMLFSYKYVHTVNYGSFDFDHLGPGRAFGTILQIEKSYSINQVPNLQGAKFQIGGKQTYKYQLSPNSKESGLGLYRVALGVFMDVQHREEYYQDTYMWPHPSKLSAFSLEDHPSDYIAFITAMRMHRDGETADSYSEEIRRRYQFQILEFELGGISGLGRGVTTGGGISGRFDLVPLICNPPPKKKIENPNYLAGISTDNDIYLKAWPASLELDPYRESSGKWRYLGSE